MDELLKQALCSVGITYLVLRAGRSIVFLVRNVTERLAPAETEHPYPDQR